MRLRWRRCCNRLHVLRFYECLVALLNLQHGIHLCNVFAPDISALVQAGEKETLVKFGAQFDDVKFSKGMDIAFTCLGNTTVTCIDGKEVGIQALVP